MNKKSKVKQGFRLTLLNGLFLSLSNLVFSQPGTDSGQAKLRFLLEMAEKNYPAIAVKEEEAEAAKNSVLLEENTWLPSLDASYQANYSTYNNITGMSYPGQLMPISGPPSTGNFNDPVPGSGASLLLNWEPLTFGQRSASIEYNQKLYEKRLGAVEDEVLRTKFKVAFLYLDMVAANELMKAYQKNIERNEFNLVQVSTLINSGLRPAVDSLKFRGELSRSNIELFKLQNQLETQKQQLQELLVLENLPDITPDSPFFVDLPNDPFENMDKDSRESPALRIARSGFEAEKARLKQINRSWAPRLEFWGTAYARGSGIRYDGEVNKAEGWSFSRYNYGMGLQLIFPVLDLTNVKLRSTRQEWITRSAESNLRYTKNALIHQENIALNDLNTSRRIAKEAPVEYRANESAYKAIQRRYNEGLIDYTELIQSQYDLLNSEAGLKNAYVDAWKALLNLAVIHGDINIFLNQLGE